MNEVKELFTGRVKEPKIVTMKLKDLLNTLSEVDTLESESLRDSTLKSYLNPDYSKWDLDIEDDAYSKFIEVLEDMNAELIYSIHHPIVNKENKLRQEKKLFTINNKIDTRWPKVVEGFSRKEGWKEVSVEDVLKYIASDGEPFVNPLGSLWIDGKVKEYRF